MPGEEIVEKEVDGPAVAKVSSPRAPCGLNHIMLVSLAQGLHKWFYDLTAEQLRPVLFV